MNMKQLNKPWLAALLIVIAAVLIFVSVKWTNKVTHKTGRDSIYLNKEDQEEMIKAFQDGSAYSSGAAGSGPAPTAAPAPETDVP